MIRAVRQRQGARPASRRRPRAGRAPGLPRRIAVIVLALSCLVGADLVLRATPHPLAKGVVVRPEVVLTTGTSVRVTDVTVRPGQRVRAGDLLLRVSDPALLDRIAEHSLRVADLFHDETRLRIRLRRAELLLPAGENETPADDRAEARADLQVLPESLSAMARARGDAETALDRLRRYYADGAVRASADGIVGPDLPVPGATLPAGGVLARLRTGPDLVLALLPDAPPSPVRIGEPVEIRADARAVIGHIDALQESADGTRLRIAVPEPAGLQPGTRVGIDRSDPPGPFRQALRRARADIAALRPRAPLPPPSDPPKD